MAGTSAGLRVTSGLRHQLDTGQFKALMQGGVPPATSRRNPTKTASDRKVSVMVIEAQCISKHTDAPGDDIIFISDDFLAVIDGATPKDEYTKAVSGGRHCAESVANALSDLPPASNIEKFLSQASDVISRTERGLRPAGGWPFGPPSCSAVVVSAERREIWGIGEGSFRVSAEPYYLLNPLERIAATVRSIILRAKLLEGASVSELQADDPGRQAALPLLRAAQHFRNRTATQWGFAALDGSTVPKELIKIWRIPEVEIEGVIASDGYPVLGKDLQSSERALEELQIKDPLLCTEYLSTKCKQTGDQSFDDRSLIRFKI